MSQPGIAPARRARQPRGRGAVPTVHAVERAARILFAFSPARPVLRLGEIGRAVTLSKSTARRLLLTLERLGLVTGDGAAGLYRLGTRCLTLAAAAQASIDLRTCALPVMRRLVDEAGESAYLLLPRGAEAICVEIVEARRGPRVLFTDVGTAFPLDAGAAPRALLAALPEAAVRAVLGRRRVPGDRTRPTAAAVRRDLATIRAAGYALSVEELVPGFAGVGAVIRDHRGEPVAALSISGLKTRYVGPEGPVLARAVMRAAAEISRALGCPEVAPGRAARGGGR